MSIPVYCAWCGDLTGHRELQGGKASYGGLCIPCLAIHFPDCMEAASGLFEEGSEAREKDVDLPGLRALI